MRPPRINPVGLVEYPETFSASPRRAPVWLRVLAAAMLLVFAFVVVSTTIASGGGYCLTSHGGDTRTLPSP